MTKGPISRKEFFGLSAVLAGALGASRLPALPAPWRADPGRRCPPVAAGSRRTSSS
jgi:hypothetical protein